MSVVSNNILAGASGQGGGYQIDRSLRFNNASSSYLSRTPSSNGNLTTWTLSCWFKIVKPGTDFRVTPLFSGSNPWGGISIYQDKIRFAAYNGSSFVCNLHTSQVLRDPSAWYSLVVNFDSNNGIQGDRARLFLNGERVTAFGTATYPGLGDTTTINTTGEQRIGHEVSNNHFSDQYLADVHFIDGQALAPTAFGAPDDNGVWQPKKFAGTYGPLVNQSQTWSSAGTYSTSGSIAAQSGSIANVFNGNSTSGKYINANLPAYAEYVFSSVWSGSNTFALIAANGTGSTGGGASDSRFQLLDASNNVLGYVAPNTASSTEYPAVTLSNVAKIRWYDQTAIGLSLYGIKVNGKLLVDSGVTVTDNSFHLDFKDNSSNAALGTDTSVNSNTWTVNNLSIGTPNARSYASDVTSTSGFPSGHEPIFGFDGNLNLYTLTNTGADTITFTPTGGIAYSSSIKINMPTAGATASVNGGTAVSVANSVETAIATGSGTLTSLVLTGTNKPGFFYIKVDDQILLNSGLDSDNDSLVDTPTNGDQTDTGAGGEVVGNYAAWNPLDKHSAVTLANGNLDISQSSSGFGKASIHVSSGKWYWEQTRTDTVASVAGIALSSVAPSATYLGGVSGTAGFDFSSGAVYSSSPITKVNSSNVGAQANGSVAGFALDCDNGTLKLYINGVLQTANHITFTPGTSVTPAFGTNGTAVAAYPTNFGQRAFAYTAPSGYKALCTANLSDPTIADGSQYFDTKLYTGNGSSQTISGLNMSPDFVWIKSRNYTYFHNFFDAIRGTGKALYSNNSNAETVDSGSLTAFNSNGFDVGSSGGVNASGTSYAAWAWDAGSSNTTIAAGGLNSSVYDQSQNWTNLISFNAGGWNGNGTNPFDADATNTDYGNTTRANGGYATLDVSSLTGSRVISVTSEQTEVTITHAGGTTTYTPTTTSRLTHTFAAVTNPTSIKFDGLNSNSQFVLVGVTVDGKRLVNSNITPPNVPSIASTVRANPSAGFSIVSYAGHNDVCTIGHGLNTEPHFAIFKNRDVAEEWVVYHKSIGNTNDLVLNSTVAVDSASNWNNTTPTSSVISLGYTGQANESGSDYIAYCFAPVEGYSAFGSYTGNGNADGPFVFTGFRPKFLLMKSAGAGNWVIIDSARDTYNIADGDLYPDESNAEGSNPRLDILSNGFKLRSTYTSTNPSGTSVIYAAFAENPFKTARAR